MVLSNVITHRNCRVEPMLQARNSYGLRGALRYLRRRPFFVIRVSVLELAL
ncbi:MAG: hypothetical protein K9I59_06090 [Chlorobium sp.]|uniref:hypothetical protein n=1 Tax=Chlorobium sp. TaxID=1095 RepID=UPI0025BE81A2|nr:hypothetical protein [Chlorobium sp.]MCF8271248.1 hypothetical protein [Chlorobium sp.]MCF8287622.1 hypothetical protein [Chlorobium sp.]MCF8291161.1 hypothetical protein [Chlorobium sp.]MCF8385256.1 hypothetical protein [Chlorobium sp.]